MSQAAVILPGSPLTGASAAADINAAWAAQVSKFSGSSAPTLGPGAASALVEGQDWLDTSVSPNVWRLWDGTTWCPVAAIDTGAHVVSPALSWRNLLGDNGGLEVWQRGAGSGASFAVGASATAYTADRWYLQTQANEASTVAAVAGLTGNSNLAAKVTRNSGQTGNTTMVFAFPLDTDEIVHMLGRKVTLNFFAKAGANWSPTLGTLSVILYVGTGSVGKRGLTPYAGESQVLSASTNIAVSALATITVTSAAVVPISTTQAEVTIFWTPTGTAGADDSITIDDVQLEVGTFASPFERVPFEKSLLGCKRHYWKTFLYSTAPAQSVGTTTGELYGIASIAGAGTERGQFVRHPVSMRANPAVSSFNPSAANAQVRDETQAADCSGTSISSTAENILIFTTGNVATVVGNLLGVHLTADAGI